MKRLADNAARDRQDLVVGGFLVKLFRIRPIAILAAGLIALVGAVALFKPAPAAASPPTHVVCLDSNFNQWRAVTRPHHCNLHSKSGDANGHVCWCMADTEPMVHLHWSRWSNKRAHGRGKLGVSTVGLVKTRVTLFRARWGWAPHGHEVRYFSRARITSRFGKHTINLNVPKSRWI